MMMMIFKKIMYRMGCIWQVLLVSNSFFTHVYCSSENLYNRIRETGEVEQPVSVDRARMEHESIERESEPYGIIIHDGIQYMKYITSQEKEEICPESKIKEVVGYTDNDIVEAHSSNTEQVVGYVDKDIVESHSSNSKCYPWSDNQGKYMYTSKDLEVNDEKLPDEIFADMDDDTSTEEAYDTFQIVDMQSDIKSYNADLIDSNSSQNDIQNVETNKSIDNETNDADNQVILSTLENYTNTTAHHVLESTRDNEHLDRPAKRRCKNFGIYKSSKATRIGTNNSLETTAKNFNVCSSGDKQPSPEKRSETLECSTAQEPNPFNIISETLPIFTKHVLTRQFFENWIGTLKLIFCSSVINKIFSESDPAECKSSAYLEAEIQLRYISYTITKRAAYMLFTNQYLRWSYTKSSNWNEYNDICIFRSKSKQNLNISLKKPREIDLFMDNSEWEQNEFPEILRKLEEAKKIKNPNIVSEILLMILDKEIDLASIFLNQNIINNTRVFNIFLVMDILTTLLGPIRFKTDNRIQLHFKCFRMYLNNITRYFIHVLKKEQRCLKMRLLPEIFSLLSQIDRISGTLPFLKNSNFIVIYSLSNLHHMLKCIEKQTWYSTSDLTNTKILSMILFMRETLIVPFIVSLSCHTYTICVYMWLSRLEHYVLLMNDIQCLDGMSIRINPFSVAFFYFFFVAHVYEFPERLLEPSAVYDTDGIQFLFTELSTFCMPYFVGNNMANEFYFVRLNHKNIYDHIYESFYDKSYGALYYNVNMFFNILRCSSEEEIASFLQTMTFAIN